jgi:hypothetical protein
MKIISEGKIQELLKDKKITEESYKKSFSVIKPKEKTLDEKRLETLTKQTAAIEKLSVLLEKNLTSKDPQMLLAILEKVTQDKDSMVGSLATVLKEHFEKMSTMFVGVERPVRLPGKWKFNIHRDLQGRIESVEAEPEE